MTDSMVVWPVTREEATVWAWMNGKAGVPAVPARDEHGIVRGHMLRGPGWRLVYQPDGEVLLLARPELPELAYFTAGDGEQP